MRALDTIAESIRIGHVHPTVVLNTLIEVENENGLNGVRHVERHIENGMQSLKQRQHPHLIVAEKWLGAARAYLLTQAERKQAV
ncbi:hypothetical protein D3875_11315 [Deinococcus cavernae]|uniref:Uncharacterized protein n=2 Tax=Deinococcus TaxID=1298 RepID=A0A418V7K9_9DEIO|nr:MULTISPECIES: hypothetical protein [Deinococcus]RJF72059.1 hypothetical protein D3875_11315 [Deinococcus cavernae]